MKRLICLLCCLWSLPLLAHKPSDSYLKVNIEDGTLSGRWDIALRDLDFALGLDSNDDGAITWGELRAKQAEITDYAFTRLQIINGGDACPHKPIGFKVDEHTDGKYAVLSFTSVCASKTQAQLSILYNLFADIDPQHRGLLNLSYQDKTIAAVLTPKVNKTFDFATRKMNAVILADFIGEGIWHIWIGFDHILFLLSLLLPSVLVYESAKWRPVDSFKPACWDVVKVVTAFTVAHSITLSLAALGVVQLPSRWVESAIAASVILAALNNVVPVLNGKRPLLAFVFGLVHGFGFASVLADLGLAQHSTLWGLLGFNLGVEIGQLALVLLFLPVIYRLSRTTFYKPVVLNACSLLIAALASLWLVERSLNISIQL